MNEKEMVMNEEVNVPEVVIEEEYEETGLGTGIAMLIGSGLTLAAIAGVKFGKKAYHKAKDKIKNRKSKNDDEEVIEADYEVVDEESDD